MTTPKTKPLGLDGQGLRVQRLKSFCNSPIISQNKPKSQESGYQKLINHVTSGDSESARELLENSDYSGILADFWLSNAELDMRLQVLGDVLPVGGCDD
jgi:hypothetical protein